MTLTTLLTAVRGLINSPSADSLQTDAVLTVLINEALHMIEVEHDWPWLETVETIATVSGTESYTPTTGWMRTLEVTIAGFDPLERKAIQELDRYTTNGRPTMFAVFQEKLFLRAKPDAVYSLTHRYIKTEPDLSAGSDTPLMPASYHNAIVELAAFLALRRQRDGALAEVALANYERWLSKMKGRGDRVSESIGGGEVAVPVVAAPVPQGR